MQTKLLINGKLVAGEGRIEEVLNPATGKVLAKVPRRRARRSTPPSRQPTQRSTAGRARHRRTGPRCC